MRWKVKEGPKSGDVRYVTRFLFFPMCLQGEWRWLEVARIREEYMSLTALMPEMMCGHNIFKWVDKEWAQ